MLENTECTEHIIEGKKIQIYTQATAQKAQDATSIPIIYLNMYGNDNGKLFLSLKDTIKTSFCLVVISNLMWDCDMCPWGCPPLSKTDTACIGGADKYLQLLTQKIVPFTENKVFLQKKLGSPLWRRLLGYSLGGLFALYSCYKTNVFQRIASVSGSLWYPNLVDFVKTTNLFSRPECIYFSLGDKEAKTKNKFLKNIQINTQEIYEYFLSNKIKTTFVLNEGNHFKDAIKRTAKAIKWLFDFDKDN